MSLAPRADERVGRVGVGLPWRRHRLVASAVAHDVVDGLVERRPRPVASWLARRDPLVLVCCLVATAVYLAHGFDGIMSRDLGVYMYAGQQVADGTLPYLGILNRAGPLAHVLPGIGVAGARLVGADDVLGARVLFMLLSVAAIGVAYCLARDLFRSRLAGLACAAALLGFQGFTTYATYGPREKTAMVLFLLCTMLAIVHQRWATTGLFVALGTLTWQPVFLAAMGAALVAVLLGAGGSRAGRSRALLRLAVGGLVPAAVVVATYAAVGELQVLLDDFVLINARYTHQQPLLDHGSRTWVLVRDAYGWSLWLGLVGVVALLALSGHALARRPSRHDRWTAAVAGSGVALLAGIGWSLRAFNSWPDAFVVLPVAALGVGGAVAVVARLLPQRAAVALTTAGVVAASAMALSFSVEQQDHTLDRQRSSVDAVTDDLPGAEILSVNAPAPLVLAGQRNASRIQVFSGGLTAWLDHTWPGGRVGYGTWIAERAPTVIAIGGGVGSPGWLRSTLEEEYVHIGRAPGWRWFVRLDVPAEVRQELRARLADPTGAGQPTDVRLAGHEFHRQP